VSACPLVANRSACDGWHSAQRETPTYLGLAATTGPCCCGADSCSAGGRYQSQTSKPNSPRQIEAIENRRNIGIRRHQRHGRPDESGDSIPSGLAGNGNVDESDGCGRQRWKKCRTGRGAVRPVKCRPQVFEVQEPLFGESRRRRTLVLVGVILDGCSGIISATQLIIRQHVTPVAHSLRSSSRLTAPDHLGQFA